jgi:hypothetical protein
MISKENLIALNQFAGKFSDEYIKQNISIGWYEDDRQEDIYTNKSPGGDFPLTKGLRVGNKALLDTCYVVIKIKNKYEAREVRFHDDDIVEILSEKCGYAKYIIDGTNYKYIKLLTGISPSISSCILKIKKIQKKENNLSKSFIYMIHEICIKLGLAKKVDGNIWFINDLPLSINIWCSIFYKFAKEEKVISENFYSNEGISLHIKVIKKYIEQERENIYYRINLKLKEHGFVFNNKILSNELIDNIIISKYISKKLDIRLVNNLHDNKKKYIETILFGAYSPKYIIKGEEIKKYSRINKSVRATTSHNRTVTVRRQ